ncbi:hypothetical protein ABKS89_18645 [Pseudomonas sp. LABIM340]|uniref:Flagellar protein FliT n=1 Tax=Pseudomonas nitroreducens TaxID=46680 RepID=A0A5R9ACD2_PSENT|nr:hypothetical protein [Pseudomonas nitroreducens]TLP76278.1 hypothetical protein FEA48_07730 [Pseudomonas nitroreducens]
MPHVDDRQRLLQLYERLGAALQRKDWKAMGQVDLAIRAQLVAMSSQTGLAADVLLAKKHLKRLHEQASQACAEECERLRRLLLSHLEYAEGRSAYMQVDTYQEGR